MMTAFCFDASYSLNTPSLRLYHCICREVFEELHIATETPRESSLLPDTAQRVHSSHDTEPNHTHPIFN